MPYTLTKGLLWFLLALLIGMVIGWLLRSIRATSQLRSLRGARHDAAELERLRGRVANLEPVVAERDRLQAELAGRDRAPATHASEPIPTAPAVPPDPEPVPTSPAPEVGATEVVLATEVVEVVALDPETAQPADTVAAQPAGTDTDAVTTSSAATDAEASAAVAPEGAGVALSGPPIEVDDLTVIEGIDPVIAGLCRGIGITTWAELAVTEVSLLRTMLADAGPRTSAHHPDTWPQQARLLAAGRWEDFRTLVATLDGGEPSE